MTLPPARHRPIVTVLFWMLGGLLAIALGTLVWVVPAWQLGAWTDLLSPADLLTLVTRLRVALVLVVAVPVVVLVVLLMGWRVALGQEALAVELRQVAARHRLDLLAQAIGHLADDHREVRTAAIYLLEQVAREAAGERRAIWEILAAFVREHAPWREPAPEARPLAPDVQAALTVLGRRPRDDEADAFRLDLRDTDLRGARLKGVRLAGAILSGAHLEGADLQGADLQGADLRQASLAGADLVEADLRGADLRDARLDGAYLVEAHLERADLGGARLEGAYLGGAHLEEADLSGAHLEGAYLYKAHLEGTVLHGARILTAIGLDRSQREAINRTVDYGGPPRRPARRREGTPEGVAPEDVPRKGSA